MHCDDEFPAESLDLAVMIKSLFSRSAWTLALTRGDRAFFAGGSLYLKSPRLTHQIASTLTVPCAQLGGAAFVKFALASLVRGRAKKAVIAILLAGVGRLGNSVVQIINTVNLAQALDARQAFYFRYDGIGNQDLELSSTLTLSKTGPTGHGQRTPDVLWRTYAINGPSPAFSAFDELASNARSALAEAILGDSTQPKTNARALTIHLRSGDIFGNNPHPSYGQPPLAHYLAVLESDTWDEVILVAEDHTNPCYRGIVEWCTTHRVLCRDSGASVNESIKEISRASNLVVGTGTFAPSIVYLAQSPVRVFTFGEEVHPFLADPSTTVTRIRDTRGTYTHKILSDNWANTHEQRELMVNYPMSALTLEEIPCAH